MILLIISTQIIASTPNEKEGLTGNFDLGLNYTQNIDKTLQFNNVFLANYKYKKSVLNAIIIGTLGTILIGTLSDAIFPFIGASIQSSDP